MAVTMEDMRAFLGDGAEAWLAAHPGADFRLKDCEARLMAYILPNSPRCDAQRAAFARAACAQTVYELSDANAQLDGMPVGLTAVTIDGFSARFERRAGDGASAAGLCRRAWAELMGSGLACRGVSAC